MLRTAVLAMLIVLPASGGQTTPLRVVALQDLTVPAERLFPGCALAPTPTPGNKPFRPRNLASLPTPTNPWTGADKPLIATIRQRIDGPMLVPDGPPLTSRQLATYRLQLAEGIDEGYAAIYSQSESAGSPDAVVVYALRFASAEAANDFRSRHLDSNNPRIIQVGLGRIVAVIHGDSGKCFQTVGAYVKSLVE